MRGRRLVGLAIAAILLPGCLDAYRAVVDPGTLSLAQQGGLAWMRTDQGITSNGLFGSSTVETDYNLNPSSQPPYTAVLLVFGVRSAAQHSTQELLDLARAAVVNWTATDHIEVEGQGSSGVRALRNGLQTHWFVLEGTVKGSGGLFPQSSKVRFLGEVGYDGLSSTHIIVIGKAQIAATQCPPIIGACQTTTDERSWDSLAGDTQGSIDGAVSSLGLVSNLVTHG